MTVTLTYFNGRGLGQYIRVLLSYLEIPFEDMVMKDLVLTDEFRKTLPFGQLPVYSDDKIQNLSQTDAITKFIAKNNNFYGKTDIDQVRIDEIIMACHIDIFCSLYNDIEKFKLVTLPRAFSKLEERLSKSKYLVGDCYSLADLYVYVTFDYVQFRIPGELTSPEKYPNLEKLKNYFESTKGVSNYISKRPETPF
ncbi:hypothetical protein ACTFIZ_001412 [Dictyostelium cf. discoideum]